jgi:hypothetical protein
VKRINLAAVTEWDDLELLRADAGKVFSKDSPSEDDWATYRRLNDRVPPVEIVEVVIGNDNFLVSPGPSKPTINFHTDHCTASPGALVGECPTS